jgi:hypothetical protein
MRIVSHVEQVPRYGVVWISIHTSNRQTIALPATPLVAPRNGVRPMNTQRADTEVRAPARRDFEYGAVRRFSFIRPGGAWVAGDVERRRVFLSLDRKEVGGELVEKTRRPEAYATKRLAAHWTRFGNWIRSERTQRSAATWDKFENLSGPCGGAPVTSCAPCGHGRTSTPVGVIEISRGSSEANTPGTLPPPHARHPEGGA